MSADVKPVEFAEEKPVSADKKSAVWQGIPTPLSTQGRPRSGRPCIRNAWGMSWQAADFLSADTTGLSFADNTFLLAGTQQVWRLNTQQNSLLGNRDSLLEDRGYLFEAYTQNFCFENRVSLFEHRIFLV